MLKTVWLIKPLMQALSGENMLLRATLEQLLSRYGARAARLYFREPDASVSAVIRYDRGRAVLLPEASAEPLPDKGGTVTPEGLYLSLSAPNTSVFGFVLLEGAEEQPEEDRAEERANALASFASLLYSEGMGSIVRSFNETLISVKDLCVEYRAGQQITRAVNSVSMDICQNEFTVIFGTSGCGKTSVLNAVGGMLSAASGSILADGADVTKMSRRELTAYRRDEIGFVFQHYNLIPELTAEENIRIAAALVKDSLSPGEALALVGLDGMGGKYPGQMSGGQQQRVCIARALAKKPRILLCDEPTGALDTENAKHVIAILKQTAARRGLAVVMITHNPDFAPLADHCFVLSEGRVIREIRQPFPLSAADIAIR